MSFVRNIVHIFEILLAMSGVVVRRITVLRGASILVSLVLYGYCLRLNSFTIAVWYFACATLVHYVLLFGMFSGSTWSEELIARFGEERGFRIYEAWMAFVFFHNGASTSLVCSASSSSIPQNLAFVPMWLLQASGITLSCVGLPIKIWATATVGIDTYYYRDLFLRRSLGEYTVAGPYKFFANPMYGVGHLHGYGTALLAVSLPGLVIVALNQAFVWLFYFTVEKPHVEKIFQESLETTSLHKSP
jgi:protein-S-isoprenylcysteine O-methyltransferase Ste14